MNGILKPISCLRSVHIWMVICLGLAGLPAAAQSLVMVSGNGQLVGEHFSSISDLVVRAQDAAGNPLVDVPITWTIANGPGTVTRQVVRTRADGTASASFLGSANPPGTAYEHSTVTASSPSGSVNFIVTTYLGRQASGATAAPPLVEFIEPSTLRVEGTAGSVVPSAIQIRVTPLSGISPPGNQGIPNVSVRIRPDEDPATTPAASCNGPGGVILTNSQGFGTCDLILNRNVGTSQFVVTVGEIQNSRRYTLVIREGTACAYTIFPASQSFPSGGGNLSINVTSTSSCAWTAASNASWITVASGASGTGNGSTSITVAANTGPARTGTVTIAGQAFAVSQAAVGGGGPGPLTITSAATLPSGAVGSFYSGSLNATGGTPPYTWTYTGSLPGGLSLNSAGLLSGTPTTAGTQTFTATLRDAANAVLSQAFSITIGSQSGGTPTITNTSLPNGVIGVAYEQALNTVGGCSSPFAGRPTITLFSGTLPPGLTLRTVGSANGIGGTPTAAGSYPFTLRVADSCGAASMASLSITIGSAPVAAEMTVAPAALTFTVAAGSTAPPAAQSLTLGAGSPLDFTVVSSSDRGWLSAIPGGGRTPQTLSVSVANFSSLAAGTYSGQVVITSAATNSPVTVPVTLNVTSTPSVPLTVAPPTLVFTHASALGTSTSRQFITVNSGSVPSRFSVRFTGGGDWLSVDPSVGQTPASIAVNVNSGGLAPGGYSALITITPEGNPGSALIVPVQLTVTPPPVLRANPLSVAIHVAQANVPQTQSLTIESTGGPLRFSATPSQPWLTLSPSSGTTPATLLLTVNAAGLASGAYTATINVLAEGTLVPVTVPVRVTVDAGAPVITAVTNAASFQAGPIAPGELVVLFGSGMGPANILQYRLNAAGMVDTGLSETRVLFDDIAAPVLYTSQGQVSAIVPFGLFGRFTTRVQVEYRGVRSAALEIPIAEALPGIFTLNSEGQGAILNQDGSVNDPQNGASPGSIISIYATGAGITIPASRDGEITTNVLATPRLPVAVEVGFRFVDITYAGSAPGLPAGVIQVNARLPLDIPRGARVPITLQVGDTPSQRNVFVAIR